MLVVRQANDPGNAVRRSKGVGDIEAFETEDSLAALRKVVGGGRAHSADADHNHIEPARHSAAPPLDETFPRYHGVSHAKDWRNDTFNRCWRKESRLLDPQNHSPSGV